MPRRKTEDLEKVTINLTRGDMEFLQTAYPEIGASKVIRTLVREHCRRIEERMPKTALPSDVKVG